MDGGANLPRMVGERDIEMSVCVLYLLLPLFLSYSLPLYFFSK